MLSVSKEKSYAWVHLDAQCEVCLGAAIRISRQLLSAFKTCKLSVIVATWNLAVLNERSWRDLSPHSGIMNKVYVLIIIHSYINSSSTRSISIGRSWSCLLSMWSEQQDEMTVCVSSHCNGK